MHSFKDQFKLVEDRKNIFPENIFWGTRGTISPYPSKRRLCQQFFSLHYRPNSTKLAKKA